MVKAIYVVIVVIIILILLFIAFNKSSQHGGDITTDQETYVIRTEDELGLNYRPGIKSLSSCIVPGEIDFDKLNFKYQDLDNLELYEENDYDYYIAKRIKYYLSYYVLLDDFITKLNALVERHPHIYVFKYLPPIYFNFELLKVSKKVIFEDIKGTVPYGVDIKRFKTTTMGLSDKSLIKKLKTNLNTEIMEAVIPEGIIYLTDMLGYDKLTSIELPSTLKYFGIEDECPNLHNLYLPDGMDLEISLIKNSNINNVNIDTENEVVIDSRDKYKQPITITFRNIELSVVFNNNSKLDEYIKKKRIVSLSIINSEICANGQPISKL